MYVYCTRISIVKSVLIYRSYNTGSRIIIVQLTSYIQWYFTVQFVQFVYVDVRDYIDLLQVNRGYDRDSGNIFLNYTVNIRT